MEFLKNFAVAFLTFAAAISVVLGSAFCVVFGIYWLSGGAMWGLFVTIVTLPALAGAAAVAVMLAAEGGEA